jgi:hypothetical protein
MMFLHDLRLKPNLLVQIGSKGLQDRQCDLDNGHFLELRQDVSTELAAIILCLFLFILGEGYPGVRTEGPREK